MGQRRISATILFVPDALEHHWKLQYLLEAVMAATETPFEAGEINLHA